MAEKLEKSPDTLLFPVPTILVSCRDKSGKDNLITIAWAGVVCSEPPMISISIRPSRLSYGIIKETKVFGINIPTIKLAEKTDYCGIVSGRDKDKFKECGFARFESKTINAPLVKECPVNLECRVASSMALGTHEMFIGEIQKVWVDPEILDLNGKINYESANFYSYCTTKYVALKDVIGYYGYSKK